MGMPACTITSQTAHGGIVTVGFPTVLIGFMPASRIGDLHVCPMFTGPVPHVGGPFVLGSPTVIVGEMPQSRVTDELVCVGPPDVAMMGCETVIVGMAGGGGAASAVTGISAMGASVPMQPPPSPSQMLTSELQQDGTIKTSAPPGTPLPPITLSQPGWPNLPAAQTPNFTTAQPTDVPPGTPLYRVLGTPGGATGSYWTPNPPASESQWRADNAVGGWNAGVVMAVAQVPANGLKAWMGAASPMGGQPGGGTQLWTPPGSLLPSQLTPAPWTTPAQLTQLAAQQAAQGAMALANAAQQAAQQAQQQAQQAAADAAQGDVQAAQQAANQAQQAASQAQQASQQAQQVAQQAQQAAQQAQQQAQQATAQGQTAAQQAAAQAQQQAQKAQQAAQQAQQSAQQAQQAAQQAQQSAQQSGQQAQNAATKGLPKSI
jgi:uncharacterized Zn-binding protein involved in type VI secretion